MILQELAALYDRLADDPAYGLAKPGYSRQKIGFEIVLRPDGTLHDIHDVRIVDGKKKIGETALRSRPIETFGAGVESVFSMGQLRLPARLQNRR